MTVIKVVALILTFSDGFLGGSTTGAYFWDAARCQQEGPKAVVRLNAQGHPTAFACLPTELPANFSNVIHK